MSGDAQGGSEIKEKKKRYLAVRKTQKEAAKMRKMAIRPLSLQKGAQEGNARGEKNHRAVDGGAKWRIQGKGEKGYTAQRSQGDPV